MVCEYVEKSRCCGGVRWFCTAVSPKGRIRSKAFCLDPVGSACPRYVSIVDGEMK